MQVINQYKPYLVGGLEHEWMIFPIILGMSSSQLTFTPSFFRGVGQPPTRSLKLVKLIFTIYLPYIYHIFTIYLPYIVINQ